MVEGIVNIGKESNELDEAEVFGVQSGDYVLYHDPFDDHRLRELTEFIKVLKPTVGIMTLGSTFTSIKVKVKGSRIRGSSISFSIIKMKSSRSSVRDWNGKGLMKNRTVEFCGDFRWTSRTNPNGGMLKIE